MNEIKCLQFLKDKYHMTELAAQQFVKKASALDIIEQTTFDIDTDLGITAQKSDKQDEQLNLFNLDPG